MAPAPTRETEVMNGEVSGVRDRDEEGDGHGMGVPEWEMRQREGGEEDNPSAACGDSSPCTGEPA